MDMINIEINNLENKLRLLKKKRSLLLIDDAIKHNYMLVFTDCDGDKLVEQELKMREIIYEKVKIPFYTYRCSRGLNDEAFRVISHCIINSDTWVQESNEASYFDVDCLCVEHGEDCEDKNCNRIIESKNHKKNDSAYTLSGDNISNLVEYIIQNGDSYNKYGGGIPSYLSQISRLEIEVYKFDNKGNNVFILPILEDEGYYKPIEYFIDG